MPVQCLWRCYAAESRSHCYATWQIHVQDSSSAGHGHHHHPSAHLLSRLRLPGHGPRKCAAGPRLRSTPRRCTLLDGTAVAVALMCQTAEVSAEVTAAKSSTRDDGERIQCIKSVQSEHS